MNTFFTEFLFSGMTISLIAYFAGMFLQKKTGLSFLNPLLIAIILVVILLVSTGTSYESYYSSARYISFFLTPATVALAIPLYEKRELLVKHWKAVLAGIFTGVFSSLLIILLLSKVFSFTHEEYVTFLPKSITTAIGMEVSRSLGGYTALTAICIIVTGIFGAVIAVPLFKVLHITHPIAKGIGLGAAAHAIGTSKAMELGETEGAMSSLALSVCGVVTVIAVNLFVNFI